MCDGGTKSRATSVYVTSGLSRLLCWLLHITRLPSPLTSPRGEVSELAGRVVSPHPTWVATSCPQGSSTYFVMGWARVSRWRLGRCTPERR
jgi:hypothetical protein